MFKNHRIFIYSHLLPYFRFLLELDLVNMNDFVGVTLLGFPTHVWFLMMFLWKKFRPKSE